MVATFRFKKQRPARNNPSLKLFFLLVLLLLVPFLAFSNFQIARRRADLSAKIQELQKEVTEQQKQNAELKLNLDASSQSDYLERVAREKFQLKKPGESVVAVLPSPTPLANTTESSKSWWQMILEKLGL